jgi:integrase
VQITDRAVAKLALPSGKNEAAYWDDELKGFGYRLRRSGGRVLRSWNVIYRANGRQRRVTYDAGTLTATAARAAARKLLAEVELGGDPQADKRARRQPADRTFRAAVAAYLAAGQQTLRPATLRVKKIYLTGDYFRPLHPLDITKITRADIAARITTITRQHSHLAAAAAQQHVSAFFSWTTQEGWTESNPMIGARKPARSVQRDRVLSDDELSAIWKASPPDTDRGRIVRLLTLLGGRPSEIGGMAWSELNLETGSWTLPSERSKNRRPLKLYLPAAAWEIIATTPRREGHDQLFGKRTAGFTAWTDCKAELDDALIACMLPWQLRDIRRTVATRMADLGVQPHIVECLLNHASGFRAGIAGTYNKSPYEREVTAALALWAEHVLSLAEGRESKIRALRA